MTASIVEVLLAMNVKKNIRIIDSSFWGKMTTFALRKKNDDEKHEKTIFYKKK